MAEVMIHASGLSGHAEEEHRPLRVIHVMVPGVIQIPGDVSVGEAARLMHKEHAPCVLIKDTETKTGVITHTDIVYKVVAQGLNPDDIQSRRVMSRPVQSIEFDRPVEEVTAMMASSGLPFLIVTKHNLPVGILMAQDLLAPSKISRSHIQATVKTYNEKPEGVAHPAVITQLSHRGAFVETDAPMPAGARVTLEFLLPGAPSPIAVETTVMGRPEAGQVSGLGKPKPQGGVAVQFTDVSLAGLSQISAWILRSLRKQEGTS